MPRASLRAVFPFLVAGLGTLAGVLPARRAEAVSPYLVVPEASVAEATAAYKYANMTAAEALAELDRRKVPYQKADPIAGVMAPVRLTGKLHGVHIHSSIPEGDRATSVYEVLDARLALALDDFAKILSRHDIEEVVHYSLYRPNVPHAGHGAHEAKAAPKAKGNGSTPVADSSAKVAKGATAAADSSAKVAKGTTAAAKGGAKAGAPASKPVAALPVLPAGKAFPSPASRGDHTSGRGAKQKTPAVQEKKAAPAPATAAATTKGKAAPAPATAAATTKVKPASAGRSATAPTGRGARHRSAQKADRAAAGRARTSSPAKVEPGPAAAKAATKAAPSAAANRTAAKVASKAPAAAPAKVPAPTTVAAATPAKAAATSAKGAATPAKVEATSAKAATSATASRQTWAAPGTRHPAGLAIDVAMLKKRDGQWVSVATHFRGRIGAKTCGDGVRTADTPEARELRSIVCEANDLGVFTYVLTPNYNAAHFDHFHMEIRPQVKWFLYQ